MPFDQKVSTGYAKQLALNFRDKKRFNGTINKEEPTSIWFSREQILEELGIDPSKVPNEEITGIRFYFGAYGTAEEHGYREGVNFEKLTLVMVQTNQYFVEDDKERIIYKENLTTPDEAPTYEPGPNFREANEGQFCPPPPLETLNGYLLSGL